MSGATFKAHTYEGDPGVYLGFAKGGVSFSIFLDPEDIVQLREVIENAVR